MKSILYNIFSDGMTNDPRNPAEGACRVIKHFDNYTREHKLTPFRDMIKDATVETTLDADGINKMIVANATLYGVGVVNRGVDNHTQIYTKTATGDPTSAWTTAPSATSGSSVESNIGVVVYHNYLYGVNSGGVWKWGDFTGSPSFTVGDYTTHVPTAPGLVHSKDDNMYWPSGNLILVNNNGSWSVGITFPTNSIINSLCEYGNYLAIACDQPDGTCVVYFWDRDSTFATLSEKVDWGFGSLKLIESMGGVLVGISVIANIQAAITPRVMFKYYTGSEIMMFEEFICSLVQIGTDKQKYNNLFYFLAEMTIDGTAFKGLWRITKSKTGRMSVAFDRLPRNDVALNTVSLHGFVRWGDYMFISYNNPQNADAYTVWRTDDQALYTATSIHESTINPQMPLVDRFQKKKLLAVGATYEALPVAGQVLIKYRVDGGSWITVLTETTDGAVRTEPVTKPSADTGFTDGTEYEFHIESTGGAEPTGILYKYSVIPTNQ